jgi:DNA topoisomerase IB
MGGQCSCAPSGTRTDDDVAQELAPKRRGWTRRGRKGAFRYLDREGREIRDEAALERIQRLAIPPAWKDVCISPSPRAKLQATGIDGAGRKQYLYHPDFRAAQEQAKYDGLIRFAERLPALRTAMAEHLDRDGLDRERISAIALRLINLGWLRVGSERHARESRTYGVTTLTKRHVTVRGNRVSLSFRGKHRIQVRSTVVDDELAAAMRELLRVPGGARVFRYAWEGDLYNLTSKRLNDYVKTYMGPEFSAKHFRTWGGTLLAAVALAEHAERHGFPETKTDEKRSVTAVMRRVAQQLGNTPAVCRASYVSPAVVDQYLEGRTIEDFRPRHLRVVSARQVELDAEEQALLSLLRSWRIRQARAAA